MTDNAINTPHAVVAPALRGEIESRWGKLSAAEIAGLKTNADLVTMIQSRYSIDKTKAQGEVDAFAKGRQL